MKANPIIFFLLTILLLPSYTTGQEKARPTINLSVNALRPSISGSYNYPLIYHVQLQLSTDVGYFEQAYAASSSIRLDEYFYGIGFIPEVKIYPIKRKANDFGFYFSFFSGFWGIYKIEDFDNSSTRPNKPTHKTGLVTWKYGMGVGYKIKTYKNWYINPYLGFANTSVTPDMTIKFSESDNYFSGLEGIRYIGLFLRYELKIGYRFTL
jgi:hypothetical protein